MTIVGDVGEIQTQNQITCTQAGLIKENTLNWEGDWGEQGLIAVFIYVNISLSQSFIDFDFSTFFF